MAGYDHYSMSHNARAAYAAGEVPFSKLPAKIRRLGRDKLSRYVRPSSWHHTSCKYNRTDFWRLAEVLATFGLSETDEYPFADYRDEDAVVALTEAENRRKGIPMWEYICVDGNYHQTRDEATAIAYAKAGGEAYRRYLDKRNRWHIQHYTSAGVLLAEELH